VARFWRRRNQPFNEESVVMPKNSKRIPPALKYGIYSGLGVLPTESRAKFHKFKKERFADLSFSGPSEEDIGDLISFGVAPEKSVHL
jgi:hypothetical protein